MTNVPVMIVPKDAPNGEWLIQFFSSDMKKVIYEKTGSVNVQCDPQGVIDEGKIWFEKNKESITNELKEIVKNPELVLQN